MSLFKLEKSYFTKYFCGLHLRQICISLAYLIWQNSQSLVVKIAIPTSAGLLLIFQIILCCRESGNRGEVDGIKRTFTMPTDILLHNPPENQFKY